MLERELTDSKDYQNNSRPQQGLMTNYKLPPPLTVISSPQSNALNGAQWFSQACRAQYPPQDRWLCRTCLVHPMGQGHPMLSTTS
jgi:hypothetical protein